MRVNFNNIFKDAIITATNSSFNYLPSNLIHSFLRKRFQSTGVSSVITAAFTVDQTLNNFFYGFHNITSLTVVFKNSVSATLLTIPITSPEDIGVEYFTELTTVRSVEITITGPDPVYLGGIGGDSYYQMPDPLANYNPDNTDNSDVTESPFGQTLQNLITPLRSLEFGFKDIESETAKIIEGLYKSVGVGKPLFWDLYEDNRDKEAPLYGKITSPLAFPYSPRRHDFSLSLLEAR